MIKAKSKQRLYIAIDLKSFYASVECVERGLDPLDANLVVADASRTEKTICLAVSPALKARGVSGRPRLFEVVQRCNLINEERRRILGHEFTGSSASDSVLKAHPELKVDYIVAKPRMSLYVEYSNRVVETYLKYVSADDLDVYSVDEVFIDATEYLASNGTSAMEFAMCMVKDVLKSTGITATAGIGTNLYLAKIAMDIEAKHSEADENGVRIAFLDEELYRRKMWTHVPITDFWRVGPGIAARLAKEHIFTMGDIARCSLGGELNYYNEELLYEMFGVNAELLIDHAWGCESATMADIKKLKPQRKSLGVGQVLSCPYDHEKAALIVWEMAEQLSLDLVSKGYTAKKAVLHIGYDTESLKDPKINYLGKTEIDHYGRTVPAGVRGTVSFGRATASTKIMTSCITALFKRIADPVLLVRRVSMAAFELGREGQQVAEQGTGQLDLFASLNMKTAEEIKEEHDLKRELKLQKAIINLKQRMGKNAIFRGADLLEGATTIERNSQIGGHRA